MGSESTSVLHAKEILSIFAESHVLCAPRCFIREHPSSILWGYASQESYHIIRLHYQPWCGRNTGACCHQVGVPPLGLGSLLSTWHENLLSLQLTVYHQDSHSLWLPDKFWYAGRVDPTRVLSDGWQEKKAWGAQGSPEGIWNAEHGALWDLHVSFPRTIAANAMTIASVPASKLLHFSPSRC
jgi:hypothetical protein